MDNLLAQRVLCPSMSDVLAEQRALWSAAPRDWAEIAEPENEPLFAALFDASGVGAGVRLLDVACGSGFAAALGAARGAVVSGIDVTPELLAIARERTPHGDFREAGMDALPFADGSFDVVTCVNGFQFALDPTVAIGEAARVVVSGGRVGAATFAEPERNEGTALHLAMKALVTEPAADGYTPYSLSQPGELDAALAAAGLSVRDAGEVRVTWAYPDVGTALRALLASAGGARSVRAVGEARVRAALTEAMKPFQDASGAVALRNLFRYVMGVKP
jgi:SAM-dependent methyltransferase